MKYKLLLYASAVIFSALSLKTVVSGETEGTQQIIIYVLAALTLFPAVFFIVQDIRKGAVKAIREGIHQNPYTSRVAKDHRLRTIVFAVPGLAGNVVFAVFNAIIAYVSHSTWFGSLAAYYIILSILRIWAVAQERRISGLESPKERMAREVAVYQLSSYLFVVAAIVLEAMVILLYFSLGGKTYPGFTIYAAAAYTFYKIIMSVINIIKEGKRKSPLLMSIRKIGYIDACVSVLILQAAMFASFGDLESSFTHVMNGITGTVISVMVLAMGFHGIGHASRMRKTLKSGGSLND